MDDLSAYYPQPQPSSVYTYQYYQPPPPSIPAPAPAPAQPPIVVAQHHLRPQYVFASYGLPQASPNEVRTLFIAGLPEDVKTREIHNLFREFPGYQSSHLRNPTQTSQPFAFAVFSDQHSAIMAMHALHGMVFDLEKGSTLHIDLAKSNSRSKRTRIDDDRLGSKKARGPSFSGDAAESGHVLHRAHIARLHAWALAGVGSIHMPGAGNSAHKTIGYPSAQSQETSGGGAFSGGAAENLNANPCPTLFVANLGPACTEQELRDIFSRYPGFLKLKMQNTYGAPVAFVDFQDVASSTGALNSLQGTILHSSPAGEGMRLEYAKSRMGLRKKPK